MKRWIVIMVILAVAVNLVLASNLGKVKIYVQNVDDDGAWVNLYIDDTYRSSEYVSSSRTKLFSTYYLDSGNHTIKIQWKDPDNCKVTQKVEQISVGQAEGITVTLTTESDVSKSCEEKLVEYKSGGAASYLNVLVANVDDDDLFIQVFRNGKYWRDVYVGHDSTAVIGKLYKQKSETYELELRWRDPDTGRKFNTVRRTVDFTGEDTTVTLETKRSVRTSRTYRPNSTINVYVRNVDDDDLFVDVLVDRVYHIEKVKSGKTVYYGSFPKLDPGKHTIRLRWLDPDLEDMQEKGFVVYLEEDEVLTRTFSTDKNVDELVYEGFMNLV
jgi:hypothetical protein